VIDLGENPTRSFSSSRLTDRLEWKVVPWSELARDADVYEGSGEVRIGLFTSNNPVNEIDPLGLYYQRVQRFLDATRSVADRLYNLARALGANAPQARALVARGFNAAQNTSSFAQQAIGTSPAFSNDPCPPNPDDPYSLIGYAVGTVYQGGVQGASNFASSVSLLSNAFVYGYITNPAQSAARFAGQGFRSVPTYNTYGGGYNQ